MKTLYVVRHGDTFAPGTPPRRIGAKSDLPLTPNGEAQSLAVARWFNERRIQIADCFTGPLVRARRTAELIRCSLANPPTLSTAGWLDEIDHGPDEGKLESEVIDRIGSDALDRWDCLGEPPPGWPVDIEGRVAACRDAIDRLEPGVTLLVTSNGAARFILLAFRLDFGGRSMKLRTGAIGAVEIHDGIAALQHWNVRPGEAEVERPLE